MIEIKISIFNNRLLLLYLFWKLLYIYQQFWLQKQHQYHKLNLVVQQWHRHNEYHENHLLIIFSYQYIENLKKNHNLIQNSKNIIKLNIINN